MNQNISREEFLLSIAHKEATKHDKKSDKEIWLSSVWCAKVVAKAGEDRMRGETLGLANEMGRSPDTVEDRAHAYWMFEELCKIQNGEFRRFVFLARRSSYIHFSHFRALWDVKNDYNLTYGDCLSLLNDIVQHEGSISSRNLSDHVRTRFGDTRTWEYYGAKALKEISKVLQQPDTPADVREVLQEAFSKLGDEA